MTVPMPPELVDLVPMVRRQAKGAARRAPPGVDVDDLFQAGMIGLLEAHRKFKPGGGHTLESWAVGRVKCAILEEQRMADHLTRGGRELVREIARTTETLQQRLCRRPRDSEVAAALSMSLPEYQQAQATAWRSAKLSTEDCFVEALAVPAESQQHGSVDALDDPRAIEAVIRAVASLRPRMRDVAYRVCLGENMSDIGADWGITGSRVSQLNQQAMGHLRAAVEQSIGSKKIPRLRHFTVAELTCPELVSGCAGFDLRR